MKIKTLFILFLVLIYADVHALTRTDIGAYNSNLNIGTTAFVTSSFTPPANSLLVISVSRMRNNSAGPMGTVNLSGGGLTYNLIGNLDLTASWGVHMDVFYAFVGSSPNSMTLTLSDPNTYNIASYTVTVTAFNSYNTGFPIDGFISSGGTNIGDGAETQTMTAIPSTSDTSLLYLMVDADNLPNPIFSSGWNTIYNAGQNGYASISLARRESTVSNAVILNDTYTGPGTFYKGGMISLFVRDDVAVSPPPLPPPSPTPTPTPPPSPTPIPPTVAGYALRFYGNGSGDIDRVKIPLDNPNRTIDLANDFTIEFWTKMLISENVSNSCTSGNDNWITGNIIVDRDIWGSGDFGDYGISFTNGRVAFGVNNGSSGAGICGTTNVADNNWHHIAVTRNSTSGLISIFVDGSLDVQASGPLGNLSYRDGRTLVQPNEPFIVLGAEKHDFNKSLYPSFSGYLDELRFSNSVRYTSSFTKPNSPFSTDSNTVALYHFDTGSGDVITDTTGNNNGTRYFGGNPSGPAWIVSDAPITGSVMSSPPTDKTPIPVAGDLNLDHSVNSLDWSIMNSQWFTSNTQSDLRVDGQVNSLDFAILSSNWGRTW